MVVLLKDPHYLDDIQRIKALSRVKRSKFDQYRSGGNGLSGGILHGAFSPPLSNFPPINSLRDSEPWNRWMWDVLGDSILNFRQVPRHRGERTRGIHPDMLGTVSLTR